MACGSRLAFSHSTNANGYCQRGGLLCIHHA
jgi:hypothetical protein